MAITGVRNKEGVPVSSPDVISEKLRQAILSGELGDGAQLRQGELAERFGTSRIPIREALRYLEAEGLVTMQANRGFTVASLSLDEVLELMEIRAALECRAISLAVPNMLDEDFAEGERLLSSYEAKAQPSEWAEMNWRFHKLLYERCYLPRLLSLIETNYGQIGRFIRSKVSLATGKEQPQKDHWDILDLCRRGDAAAAAALLDLHIRRTQRALKASAAPRR